MLLYNIPDIRLSPTVNKIFDSIQWTTRGSMEETRDHFFPPFCFQPTVPLLSWAFSSFINTCLKCLEYASVHARRSVIINNQYGGSKWFGAFTLTNQHFMIAYSKSNIILSLTWHVLSQLPVQVESCLQSFEQRKQPLQTLYCRVSITGFWVWL